MMDYHGSKYSGEEEEQDEIIEEGSSIELLSSESESQHQLPQIQQQQLHDKGQPQPSSSAASPIQARDGNDAGGDDVGGGGNNYSSNSFLYYPMYTSSLTLGTCTNNGNEPDRYHDVPQNFLFDTLEECCQQWYVDVVGCTVGNAFPSEINGGAEEGEELLLTRDVMTGELLAGGSTETAATTTLTTAEMVASIAAGPEEDVISTTTTRDSYT